MEIDGVRVPTLLAFSGVHKVASLAEGDTGVVGLAPQFTVNSRGVAGSSFTERGIGVQGDARFQAVVGNATGQLAPESGCCVTGVLGRATNTAGIAIGVGGYVNTTEGWGTQGLNTGGGTGVLAQSRGGNHTGSGLVAQTEIGDAGTFLVDPGGTLLHGFLVNFNGPGGWEEKFKVDSFGNLSTLGTASKPGGGSWAVLSDRRTKKSIEPIDGALNQLLQLHGVTFEYSNPSAVHELPGEHIGMVAQDVEQVFPSWVDTREDGYKTLTFRGFEAVAVEAVRELDTEVNENSARIEKLERENAELKRSIEALMEKLNSR